MNEVPKMVVLYTIWSRIWWGAQIYPYFFFSTSPSKVTSNSSFSYQLSFCMSSDEVSLLPKFQKWLCYIPCEAEFDGELKYILIFPVAPLLQKLQAIFRFLISCHFVWVQIKSAYYRSSKSGCVIYHVKQNLMRSSNISLFFL